ncbi:isocitrate lyase/phosphoenolpyruvate mutase family protein [Streptosporangium sp. NPDC048865]|uniref:isocitrate lyase/PEP mutase family protein n=1 Tax=Streptosporangium sp. NPDC048865 TaxID=3155766 RepID=UPI00343ABDDE
MTTLRDKALLFRSMHVPGRPLVLPNAWDVASARIVTAAGAAAVATTSAGVSWALGYGDGDHLDRDRGLDLIARVAAAVDVPVTADVESGYAPDPAGVAETVRGVLAAGAVGVNLEDSLRAGPAPLRPIPEQSERIAAARGAADTAGVPLFINARIDTHRLPGGDLAVWLKETLARTEAYVAAGADGVFVLGALDAQAIAALVRAVPVPVNVLAGPGTLTVPALAALGVARVSAGSSIAEAAYGLVARAAGELLADGTCKVLEGGLGYGALNALLLAEPGR